MKRLSKVSEYAWLTKFREISSRKNYLEGNEIESCQAFEKDLMENYERLGLHCKVNTTNEPYLWRVTIQPGYNEIYFNIKEYEYGRSVSTI